jgi:UDP-N-acetylmuramate--alanine ligase
LCVDDPEVRALVPRLDRTVVTYGFDPDAAVRADPSTLHDTASGQSAELVIDGEKRDRIEVPMRGRHNLLNALAAVAVGRELGVGLDRIAAGIASFAGVRRRCEDHGEHGGVLVLDDYGHHPTEVVATLQVAKQYDRRVVVLFQPHRYSRTARFVDEFADALATADSVGLLPVYPAGEQPPGDVDSGLIAQALRAKGLDRIASVQPDRLAPWLSADVRPGDLLLTLGAGDIGRLVDPICRLLADRSDV